MSRPAFLLRPEVWTRAPRVSQSPAEYAEALHSEEVQQQGRAADSVIVWAAITVLSVWFVIALIDYLGG